MTSRIVALVTCDGCGRTQTIESVDTKGADTQPLPDGWHRYTITEWEPKAAGLQHQRGSLIDVHGDDCARQAFARFLLDRPAQAEEPSDPATTVRLERW